MEVTGAPVCPPIPCPLDHNHDNDDEGQGSVHLQDQEDVDEDIPSPPCSTSTFSDISSEKPSMPILDRIPIELLTSLSAYPADLSALRGPSAPVPPPSSPEPNELKSYSLPHSPQQSSDLYRTIWERIFGITNVMPYFWPSTAGPSSSEILAPPSLDEALDLLEVNEWSLVRAQAAFPFHRAKQAKLAAAKGKSPASSRAASPLPPTDPSSSSSFAFLGPEYTQDRRGRPCGHYFRKGEAIWRCRDCAIDDTCVQCAPCFEGSVHSSEGHDVVFSVCSTEGGVCDCGDDEAWLQDVGCRYHSTMGTEGMGQDTAGPMAGVETSGRQPALSLTTSRAMDRDLLDEISDGIYTTGIDANFVHSFQGVLNEYTSFILATVDHAPEEQNLFMQSFRRFNQKNARDLIWNQEDLETWSTRYDEEVGEDMDVDGEEQGLVPYMKFKELHSDDPDYKSHNEQETAYLKKQYNERLSRVTLPAFKRRLREVRRLRRQGKVPADTQLVDPLLASGDESAIASYHAPPGHYIPDDEVATFDMDTFDNDERPHPAFDDGELRLRIAKARGEEPPTRPLRTWPFKPRKYALILWNDEKHTFKDVIDIVKDAIGISDEEARGVAERVDTRGREVLIVSDSVEKLVSAARRMGGINLKVTIRPAFDVHCEEIADKLLWLLKDLSEASLYLPRDRSHLTQTRSPDSTLMPMIVSWALLQDWPIACRHEGSFDSPRMSRDAFDPKHLKKLDGLLLMDFKFWKEGRSWLRQLWLGLCKVSTGRRAVASHYAFCYSKIIEHFMFSDREPEHTLLLLTVQLFSVPSVAFELVSKYDFMRRLHDLLTALMTGGVFPAFQTIEIPPPPPRRMQPQEELQHPRLIIALRHIMYDLKYLVQSPGVQDLIVYDPRHTAYLLDWLRYFNGYAAEERETVQHVEFDGETWVLIFQVCQLLAREAQQFGQAYKKANPAQTVQALNYIVARIHHEMLMAGVDDDSRRIVLHDITFGAPEAVNSVIDFVVAMQPTAFHHPMDWFLAETSKRLSSISPADLAALAISSVPEILTSVGEAGLLAVVDMSMRCIVKLSQVRAGLWVRNGTSTRGQAVHYRDVSARFTMYDQDVFLLQAGLALMPSPDRLLVNALDRFALINYFSAAAKSLGEEASDKAAAEDLLLLLITLLSEPGIICAWTTDQLIRRELIHFLALGQGTFSSVTRFIPDHMIDHPSLEKILAQVANYRGPDGTNDQGIYELKDECFHEVDPFFHHYTRNQRERAEEQLRHREKKAGRKPEELVILPAKQLSLPAHIFAQSLLRALVAPSFRYILFGGLEKSLGLEPEKHETELELVIHLIVIGIVEGGETFVEETLAGPIFGGMSEFEALSVLSYLCQLESQMKQPSLKARVAWCIDQCEVAPSARERLASRRRAKNVTEAKQAVTTGSSPVKSAMEVKRAAAKARQAAIMQKFSAQQKTLLQSLEKEEADSKDKADATDSMDLDVKDHATAMVDGHDEGEREEALGSCIMCQEQLTENSSFGRLALISASRILRTSPRNNLKAMKDVVDVPLSLDRVSPVSPSSVRSTHIPSSSSAEHAPYSSLNDLGTSGGGFSKEDNKTGVLASSCGHLMHVNCFQTYYRNIETRHSQQIARNHAESLSRFEFVCPLCKSLGNLILPVPTSSRHAKRETSGVSSTDESTIGHQSLDMTAIGDWLRKINIDILKTSGSQAVSGVQDGSSGGSGCFVSWHADSALSWLIDRDFGSKLPEGVDGSMLIMLGRLVDVLRPMSSALRPQRVLWQAKTILAGPNSRKMYLPDELVGYTLSVLEVSQRGLDAKSNIGELGNVATAVSDGAIGLLRSLVYCLRTIAAIDRLNPSLPPSAAHTHQASLRQGLLKRLLPHWSSDEAVRSPLLLREPLSILVEAAAIVPESLGQVTTLMYYATLVQTVFGLAQPSIWPQASASASRSQLNPADISREEKAALQEIFPDVRWTVGHIVGFVGYARGNVTLGVDGLDDLTLAKMLCTYTLPFLRRAAILRRAICGDSRTSSTFALDNSASEPVEYLRLLSDLRVIPPSQGLPLRADRQAPISSIVEGWIKHAYTPLASLFRPLPINPSPLGGGSDPNSLTLGQAAVYTNQNHPTLQLEHPHVYELIALPKDLTALLMYTQRTPCKKCKTSPPEPALCLLCGEVVCYQSFCCMDSTLQKGECNLHLASCGGNYGIYFKVKSNLVFLLYHSNGTFIYSPYLDSHGEVDVGLTKGRRQTLYIKRYDDLRKIWLSGGVGTLVARKTEASMDPGGWDTT